MLTVSINARIIVLVFFSIQRRYYQQISLVQFSDSGLTPGRGLFFFFTDQIINCYHISKRNNNQESGQDYYCVRKQSPYAAETSGPERSVPCQVTSSCCHDRDTSERAKEGDKSTTSNRVTLAVAVNLTENRTETKEAAVYSH